MNDLTITGRTSYFPKDADWWGWEYVVALGEEFGPAGPSVYDYLWCLGKKQNQAGYVKTGYRAVARAVFVGDVDTVRHVVSRASQLGALDDLQADGITFTCRVSGMRAVLERAQAAARKRDQRARETATNPATEPNGSTGRDVTARDTSRSVTAGHEKSPEVKGKKRTTETSPNPSASGGERPIAPIKPSGKRKRDLDRYAAEVAAYRLRLEDWAPHAADLNGLADPWQRIDELLRAACKNASTYDQWLADVHPHRVVDGTLVLAVHSDICDWVDGHYSRLLTQAAQAVLPGIETIDLIACDAIGHLGRPPTGERRTP